MLSGVSRVNAERNNPNWRQSLTQPEPAARVAAARLPGKAQGLPETGRSIYDDDGFLIDDDDASQVRR